MRRKGGLGDWGYPYLRAKEGAKMYVFVTIQRRSGSGLHTPTILPRRLLYQPLTPERTTSSCEPKDSNYLD
jgi:hypothetical protein